MELMIIFIGVIVISLYLTIQSGNVKKYKTKEEQYYEDIQKGDKEFDKELDKIYSLIVNTKCQDLNIIAKEAKVSLTECIVKIRYLIKIGRLSNEYYIDHNSAYIVKCTKEEQKLLKKYSNYILIKKYQIKQIVKALQAHNTNGLPEEEFYEDIYKEVKYLIDKNLLKNIKIDEETQTIIYPKKGNDYISKPCPNCGAINEVRRLEEGICKYCGSVIK